MMRSLAVILFTSFSANFLSAQSFDNELDLTLQGRFIEKSYQATLIPTFTLPLKKYKVSLGPTIPVYSSSGWTSLGFPITGLQAAVSYEPAATNKTISFFLQYQLMFQHIVDQWTINFYNPGTSAYEEHKYRSRENIFENNIGYGLKIHFLKRMFLRQNIGAGFYFSSIQGSVISEGAPEIAADLDFRGYDDFGFTWFVGLGLGYKLDWPPRALKSD